MRVFCGKDTDTDTDSVYFSTVYSLHFSQFDSIGQGQKGIKQSPYLVTMGTRGIWFSAIFSLYGNCGK